MTAIRRAHERLKGAGAMGRYLINDGADQFDVRDERNAVVATGVSLVAAFELLHQGCRFCDAGENHTNDAVRSDRQDPRGRATTIARVAEVFNTRQVVPR
jgi:hypothetical protein